MRQKQLNVSKREIYTVRKNRVKMSQTLTGKQKAQITTNEHRARRKHNIASRHKSWYKINNKSAFKC